MDSDRYSTSSVGLHVGTFNSARDFSANMLVVLVDPADVVAVPASSGDQKMVVCRLFVAALHDGEQVAESVIKRIRTVPDFAATEAYVNRPENRLPASCGYTVVLDGADNPRCESGEDCR
ncbi:hypothetical protein MAUB_58790 [Mycolicibacterium aubagnense]|uniref:Uncharacterized protein n=1 Tax=Mycolicibacterium aubagnense TaxID=319707 RepID=A0ABN5Z1E7_9MYCO|nr:hypothetical protein MAUB_58790 [Mycolicibacterium aubagnense]